MSALPYNKISCSLNNSAAIGENGEIYVWGSGKYGLTYSLDTETRAIPCNINIQKINQFYEGIHISCGLYHMAAIVKNSIIDKIDLKREPSELFRKILKKQKKAIEERGIDLLEKFEISNYPDGFVPLKGFQKFIQQELINDCDYSIEEKRALSEFIYYFSMDMPEKVHILQYYYFINQDENYYSAYIWGVPDNGRLGLSSEQMKDNELIAEKKKTHKPQEEGTVHTQGNEEASEISQGDENFNKVQIKHTKSKYTRIGPTKVEFKVLDKKVNINIAKISCGHHHTMALDERGILYTWGMGSQGCLGNGKLKDVHEPQPINLAIAKPTFAFDNEHDVKFKDIACGSYHSMALAVSEDLYTWGANTRGQLGQGHTNNVMKPEKINFFSQEKLGILSIDAGDQHSAAISSSFELYTWGCGAYYRLGHGLAFDELIPKKVEVLEDVYVNQVSCGVSHTLCITNEGFIYGWGNGMCGKLGIEEKCTKNYILPTRIGTYLGKFRRKTFQEVCAGPLHSITLTEDGIIYSWGSAKNGILGLDRRSEDVYLPMKIPSVRFAHRNYGKKVESSIPFESIYFLQQFYGPERILYNEQNITVCAVACAARNTFFLSQDGKLFAAGSNETGLMVRNPLKGQKIIEEHVNMLKQNTAIVKPAKGTMNEETSPLLTSSPMRSMGSKNIKNPGEAEQKLKEKLEKGNKSAPIPIHYFKKKLVFIACSYNHAMAINEAGRVFTWGANSDYQLGLGFLSKYEYIPQRLGGALETKIVKMCVCSEKFSALLTDSGEVWTFGTSEQGSLGHEEKNSYIIPIPKMINDIPEMIFIAAGPEHMMAVSNFKNDKNELWAWGNNIYGQLGVSNPIMATKEGVAKEKTANDIRVFKPKQVPLIIGDYTLRVEMVSLGMYHSVLLSVDKYLYSCGLKKYAGLPLNDVTQAFEYVDTFCSVINVKSRKFKMVSCGEFHTLALSDSNDVFGWGSSLFGRLGESNWKGGEESLLDTQIGGNLRRTLVEDSKLIVTPSILFENKDNSAKKQMRFLACGPTHSAGINRHGEAYTWGSSIGGKLGVKQEEFFKSSLEKEKDEDRETAAMNRKKKAGFFVMPKMMKVRFQEKKKKPDEPIPVQRGVTISQRGPARSIFGSKNSPLKGTKSGASQKDKDQSGTNSNDDSDREENKREDSDMLIREQSSIESEDVLELENEKIKANMPRESVPVTNQPTPQPQQRETLKKSMNQPLKTLTAPSQHQSYISENKTGGNMQDALQKQLFLEKPELKEERLMAEDNDLEKALRVLVERKLKVAVSLTKEYNILLNRIDAVIYAHMNIYNKRTKNIPFLKHIQHKIPTFVLQNIQLYETIFSFLKLHPCYIMNIISTHLLNNSQVNQLINILYNNPISRSSSICSLMSLSKMVFEFEVHNYFKITEIKNFKIGSIFWQIYLILFLKQDMNKNFIVSFARTTINEIFIKYYSDIHELNTDKYKFSEDKKNEKHKIMQKALEFQEEDTTGEDFTGASKNKELLAHLEVIIKGVSKYFQDAIYTAQKSKKVFVTKELTYLHSAIIDIYKQNEVKKVQESYEQHAEFEMVREDEKKKYESSMNPLLARLDANAECFIRNLYFGVLIHVIQNYEQFDIQIPKDCHAFVEKSNNLKILSELIEKYFAKEIYADDRKFHVLNELILKQTDADNKLIFRTLTEYDYFNLTLNHLVETLTAYFDYRTVMYEVSLEFLFILHNLYCKSIKTLPLETFLLREKTEDPIWIIFNYLNLEEIPINDYNSDTLRMNINLQTDPKLLLLSQVDENFQFYRCLNCDILLPRNLLNKTHSAEISLFERQGWQCQCNEWNKNGEYFCRKPGCNKVIPLKTFNYLSIINKYYQEGDSLQYLFLDVLKQMDVMKHGKDMLGEIIENRERAKKKEDHFLVGKISDFLKRLDEQVDKNDDFFNKAKNKEKIKGMICEKLRQNGLLLIKKRQDHRKYQIYLKDTLACLDLVTRDKMLAFRMAIKDLLRTEEAILPRHSDKKPVILIDENEENTMEHLKNKQFNSFGVYTSSELFSNRTLRACKFTNMEIPKILKHLKFYINSTDEGGFMIKIVYLNEHWLNIFIRCLKGYYFNEVTLQTVEISLEKYIELKRTANYKAICTFGSEKVSASFNVFYLLKILRDIESQVLIQYNIPGN